jgi:hypothetical protein
LLDDVMDQLISGFDVSSVSSVPSDIIFVNSAVGHFILLLPVLCQFSALCYDPI